MKVIFITTESLMDHSYTMVNELRKHIELEVYFVAKHFTDENKWFCEKLDAKFVKRKRFLNPLSFFTELKLLRALKKQNADLIWFNTLSFFQSILLKMFFRRPLINTHDIELHPEEQDYHGILSQKITFSVFKYCIAVMSGSQSDIFIQKHGYTPYLLPLPVINYYEASAKESALKTLKKSSVRFLFFGNIMPYKGIEILIKAVKILNEKNSDFELNIFGRLKYNTGTLADEIKDLKNVNHKNEYIDYREVYLAYSNNDVIIIPYTQVSQCGPLLIGYNQNVPCITSDLPGFREYVDDGKSGLIFDNSAVGLARKMEYVINNPGILDEMKKYIADVIKSRFSMAALAPVYVDVFRKHYSGN